MKILIINQYANNKGDRAILFFIVRELVRNGILARDICVSTNDRKPWMDSPVKEYANIRFIKWGWNGESKSPVRFLTRVSSGLKKRYYLHFCIPIVRLVVTHSWKLPFSFLFCSRDFKKALRESDLTISTGGHHLTTILTGGDLSEQMYDMALVLSMGKPLVLWAQSIGPLLFTKEKNMQLACHILEKSKLIYLRDNQSKSVMPEELTHDAKVIRTYDSVFGLNDVTPTYIPPSRRNDRIGISIYAAGKRTEVELNKYIQCFAYFIKQIVMDDHAIHFFPMELKESVSDDRPLIYEIISALDCETREKCLVVEADLETKPHLEEISKCRLFIGHKTHSVVFALTVGTPILAISYHPKTLEFIQQYHLEHFGIDDKILDATLLTSIVREMLSRIDDIGKMEYDKSAEYGAKVRSDFQGMLNTFKGNSVVRKDI